MPIIVIPISSTNNFRVPPVVNPIESEPCLNIPVSVSPSKEKAGLPTPEEASPNNWPDIAPPVLGSKPKLASSKFPTSNNVALSLRGV